MNNEIVICQKILVPSNTKTYWKNHGDGSGYFFVVDISVKACSRFNCLPGDIFEEEKGLKLIFLGVAFRKIIRKKSEKIFYLWFYADHSDSYLLFSIRAETDILKDKHIKQAGWNILRKIGHMNLP